MNTLKVLLEPIAGGLERCFSGIFFLFLLFAFLSCAPTHYAQLQNQAVALWAKGRYAEAKPYAEEALKLSEEAAGPDHPDVAISLNNLAELFKHEAALSKDEVVRKEKLAAAESMHKRALLIREKALTENHSFTIASMVNLADVYRMQKKYDEAEPLYKQAIEITKRLVGPNHPALIQPSYGLAEIQKAREKLGGTGVPARGDK